MRIERRPSKFFIPGNDLMIYFSFLNDDTIHARHMRFQDEVDVLDPDPSSLVTDPRSQPTSGSTGFNIVSDLT